MAISNLIELQGTLFLLTVLGIILWKLSVITEEGKRSITDLIIGVILPCNIINSFRIIFTPSILKASAVILIISLLIQVGCLVISNTLYNKQSPGRKKVLQYSTVCSNAGFMGNPIAEGLFGSTGLLFASVYLIPMRVVMWSAGISYFTESPNKKTLVKKVLTHPCIIAVFIGFAIMVFQIPLPSFLGSTVKSVASANIAMSMILIGTILADVDLKSMIDKTTIYYTAIRLIFIPLLVFIGCKLFHVDSLITGVSVILAGMPAGSTTVILAAKYEGDYEFATKCVVFSTLLSMFTIPIWSLFLK
jgi:predicted permease